MAESVVVEDMLDTIGPSAGSIPKGTKRVAIYLTGRGIAWTPADLALLARDRVQSILRIDQSNSVLTFPFYVIKDIEPGASTIGVAIAEAQHRKAAGLRTCFYTFWADMAAVRAAVAAAGLADVIDYFVANWNLTREQAVTLLGKDGIVAVQYASPTSNPHTLVPGSRRTLAQANIDLSVTLADWPSPLPKHKKPSKVKAVLKKAKPQKPHPKVVASTLVGAIVAAVASILHAEGVHVDPALSHSIEVVAVAFAGYFTPGSQPTA